MVPQVRRVAQAGVASLLAVHRAAGCDALSARVTDFCARVLEESTSREFRKAMQLLALLRVIIPLLPLSGTGRLCGALLRLPSLGQQHLTIGSTRTLATLVQSPASPLSDTFLQQVSTCIWQFAGWRLR